MIDSTYSVSSFDGFVSSKRRLVLPPNSSASPKSRQIALACPMCRYPLGSGGKRVCTRPPYLLVFRSSRMMSRMKFDGAETVSWADLIPAPVSGFEKFIAPLDYRNGGEAGDLADPLSCVSLRWNCCIRK